MSEAVSKSVSAYERWELPNVGPQVSRARDIPTTPLTAAQVDELQRQAYSEAQADGHKAGYSDGFESGQAAARAEMAATVDAIDNVLSSLSEPIKMIDLQVQQSMHDVVIGVAQYLFRAQLAAQPDWILRLVQDALNTLPIAEPDLTVFVNPLDAEAIREVLGGEPSWRMVTQEGMSRGGCRVEQGACTIDATLENRLQELLESIEPEHA